MSFLIVCGPLLVLVCLTYLSFHGILITSYIQLVLALPNSTYMGAQQKFSIRAPLEVEFGKASTNYCIHVAIKCFKWLN